MGITSALYSGVSGLNTNSTAMTVIGNNLANTNTVGYKGSRTIFSDLLSSTVNGSGGTSQVGRGVNMSKVDNIFSQGTFESTESGLDVAIEGDSFFLLSPAGEDTTYYSRAGAFRFDEDGFLINPEGLRVQGKEYDLQTQELLPGDPDDIQLEDTGLIGAAATANMELNTNLDASSTEPLEELTPGVWTRIPFDSTDTDSYNYSSSTQVFDSLGNPHLITTYFVKTANDNEWEYNFSYDDPANPGTAIEINGGAANAFTFEDDGTLLAGEIVVQPPGAGTLAGIDWLNGSAAQDITVTFDTTQFNSESVVIAQNQDGFSAGNLTGVDIDGEGAVIASYSNGEQIKFGHIALAKFNNPHGLELSGNNLFTATEAAGGARVGLPGDELGKIFTNSLEQSNVDMGAEFVRMITVQRGFQANSKIITTVDELLGELINLKR